MLNLNVCKLLILISQRSTRSHGKWPCQYYIFLMARTCWRGYPGWISVWAASYLDEILSFYYGSRCGFLSFLVGSNNVLTGGSYLSCFSSHSCQSYILHVFPTERPQLLTGLILKSLGPSPKKDAKWVQLSKMSCVDANLKMISGTGEKTPLWSVWSKQSVAYTWVVLWVCIFPLDKIIWQIIQLHAVKMRAGPFSNDGKPRIYYLLRWPIMLKAALRPLLYLFNDIMLPSFHFKWQCCLHTSLYPKDEKQSDQKTSLRILDMNIIHKTFCPWCNWITLLINPFIFPLAAVNAWLPDGDEVEC